MSHSIDKFYEKILKTNNENLKILQAVTRSLTSDDDVVNVTLTDSSGNDVQYRLPSYSYLLRRVNEINNNVDLLSNKETTDLTNAMSVVSVSGLNDITDLTIPNTFIPSDNSILKHFLSKDLKMEIDLTDKVNKFSSFVIYDRVTLDISTEEELAIWAEFFQGKSNQDYESTISLIKSKQINYSEDKQQVSLPALQLQYYGSFDILGVLPDAIKSTDYSVVKQYKFNKLTYSENIDENTSVKEGHNLTVGSKLITPDGKNEYIIQNIETVDSEYIVTLAMVSGFHTLMVGVDKLRIASDVIGSKTVKIPVTFAEKQIIFIKPVDPYYHITTDQWSNGVSVDSNLLQYIDENENTISLKDYFIQNVYDLEKILLDYIDFNNIPAYEGIEPDAPQLTSSNFTVSANNQIQKRSIKSDGVETNSNLLQSLRLENKNLSQELQDLEVQKQETTDETVLNDLNQHTTHLLERIDINNTEISKLSGELTSIKYEYSTKLETVQSDYSIKGFWNIPLQKKDLKNRLQDVIGFKVQYRYLDLFDNPTCNVKIKFEDLDGEVRNAIFSEWNTINSDVREKVFDNESGKYVWEFQNLEENIPNVNQVEIPIQPYSKVEIRVKSISEAGYPNNPMTSGWSNTVLVEFPNTLYVDESYKFNPLDIMIEEGARKDIDDKLTEVETLLKTTYTGLQTPLLAKRYVLTPANIISESMNLELNYEVDKETMKIFDEDEGTLLQYEVAWNLDSTNMIVEFPTAQMSRFNAGTRLLIEFKPKV